MNQELNARIAAVRARIDAAAARAGRDPREITLVAVTKTFPADVVAEAIEAGLTELGENRAQELRDKLAVLRGREASWHFIGHLQSNKVKNVVGSCSLIHSVDRFGLAEAISRRALSLGVLQDVLIQVDVAGESSKQGAAPEATPHLASEVDALPGVRVLGLMTMPPFPDEPEGSRPYFRDLRSLSEKVRVALPEAKELSMGMTRDFEIAIEEGATLVRVGEAIFGARAK